MSWKYDEIEDMQDETFLDKMCVCGHSLEDHHLVYWAKGMTADECEAFGFNELGGLMPSPSWIPWRRWRIFKRLKRLKGCVCHPEKGHPRAFNIRRRWIHHCDKFREVLK